MAAKAEIVERARVMVLNVDNPGWPASPTGRSRGRAQAGVALLGHRPGPTSASWPRGGGVHGVLADGEGAGAGRSPGPVWTSRPTNVACAVAVALSWGCRDVASRAAPGAAAVPEPPPSGDAGAGATIIDDTYNSNPAGAAAALDLLGASGCGDQRRVVVTPGMVELGSRQAEENPASPGPRPGSRPTWSSSAAPTPGPWWTGRAPGVGSCGRAPGSRRWPGWRPSSVPGTSCCTRTTCPTTSHEPRPARARRATHAPRSDTSVHIAVIFGGPSPEHDVSVLTGLQAARALTVAGHEVEASTGRRPADFFSVDPGVEARPSRPASPGGAGSCGWWPGPKAASSAEGGRLGRAGRSRCPPPSCAATAGPVRTAPSRAPSTWPAWPTPGRAWRAPPSGMDKLAFGGAVAAAGLPILPRVAPRRPNRRPPGRRPLHRQAPLRRLVHRHRGGGGLGDGSDLLGSSVHCGGARGRAVPGRPSTSSSPCGPGPS